MKKQLLFILMMMLPLGASADAVEVDGIYYNLISKTKEAEVTENPNKYAGNIVIPAIVTYDGEEYTVKNIGNKAFYFCTNLRSIIIPDGITSINYNAFNYCKGLTSVVIPNSVVSIEESAFKDGSGLTTVELSNTLKTIGDGAFSYCTSLTSLTIPNSVTTIESGAFSNCSSLITVNIPNSISSIKWHTFSSCTSLTSIIIPDNVTSIGEHAFRNCTGLTSINISDKVKTIKSHAFYGCTNLVSLSIGKEVNKIEEFAFSGCVELSDVYCYAKNVPNTSNDAFSNSYIDYVALHVPAESINAYKVAVPWSGFKSVVAIDDETLETQKCERPTICYKNGQLIFNCATEDVEYVTDITDTDIKTHYGNEIQLGVTYNISVYATKSGYDKSDVATATLCWIDTMPQMDGTVNDITRIDSHPVLVKTDNGFITVEGIGDRTDVCAYTTDGKLVGTVVSHNNVAKIATNIQPGSIAIVKVGGKSIKVIIK